MPIITADKKALEFLNNILGKDDPKCKFRLNQKVRKINFEKGDIHLEGDTGTIRGSLRIEKGFLPKTDFYIVNWDNDGEGVNVFIADSDYHRRLEAIK